MTGKFVFIGKSLGFPIPYSTEYTNPERPLKNSETEMAGNVTIPQADPNGLFSSPNTSADWILMLDANGNPQVTYAEPNLYVSQFQLPASVVQQ